MNMKLLKALATVAGMTGLSRIAGFARDILMAAILGAGALADAFFVALKLPNLFRRITAEGALSVSFVPTYSEKLEKAGEKGAQSYADKVAALLITVLLPLSILAIWAMPAIIPVIAPGFAGEGDPYRFALAVDFSRITFPYLLLMSLTALMGAMLNAHKRFAPFAFAPVLFNICLIIALLLFAAQPDIAQTAGHLLVWAITISGAIQLLWLYICVRRTGLTLLPDFRWPIINGDIKKLLKLMGPGAIGAGVIQINIFIDILLASLLPAGAISGLYYADRLNQLPLGIIGIAIGTALLPLLSHSIARGEGQETKKLSDQALIYGFMLAAPAAVAFLMVAEDVIRGLFERGAFTSEDTIMTAQILRAYAVGLPAYILIKVFSTIFFASQDTATPVKISIIATLVNIGLSIALIGPMGVSGIALATSIAAWVQVVAYIWLLRKGASYKIERAVWIKLAKVLGACLIMAALIGGVDIQWRVNSESTISFMDELKLLGLVFTGLVGYTLAVIRVGLFSFSDLKRLRR